MKLSRRNLLMQAGLWSAAWPLVSCRRARAEPDLVPKRVVVIFSPNGPIMERGPAIGTESDFELHEWWEPLARHKEHGIFMSGMAQAGVPFGEHDEYGHQSAGTGALTARTTERTNHATGPSLDQFIGQELQRAGIVTPRRSVLWGFHTDVGNWGPWYEAEQKPAQVQNDPFQALADLLPGLGSGDARAAAERALSRKHFVLDHVYEDCRSLALELGSEGRNLLDFHCQNIEALEQSVASSLDALRNGRQCAPPDGLDTSLPPDANFHQPEHYDEMMKAFSELVPLALACDATRVVGISFGGTAARFALPSSYGVPSSEVVDSGDSGPQHHAWTHVYNHGDDKRQALRTFTRWYAESVAMLLDRLASTTDIDGKSLLDSTLVLWTSELGGRPDDLDPHPNRNIPVLLFGNGGGKFRTNRHYEGDASNETALALHQLFVSIIQHTGLTHVDSFGNQGSGPLEWLYG